jgi:hypothetical protein
VGITKQTFSIIAAQLKLAHEWCHFFFSAQRRPTGCSYLCVACGELVRFAECGACANPPATYQHATLAKDNQQFRRELIELLY